MSTRNQRLPIITLLCALLILALTACDGGQSSAPTATPSPQMIEALAPIDRAEILVAESFPPQYFVLVESGLRNGCVEFDRYEVARDGDTIHVAIINLEPAGSVPCTEEYGTVEHNIPLGSDFEPGTTYTVLVNDVTETFVTQGSAPAPDTDPTPTATSAAACTVRADWFEHTVAQGDTMYNIAQRSDSSVDELAAANCLDDATQISVGQTLYVPNPIPAKDAPTDLIKFYLIIPGDNGQSGPPVGCGDSAIAVWRDRARTGSLEGDIQASLEELLSVKTATYGQSGYTHALYAADLIVQSVTVSGDTALIVNLTGALQLVGTCADAQMEAQILLSVFQYPGVNSALITIEGKNIKQLFDTSGTVGDDEPYRRSEVQ